MGLFGKRRRKSKLAASGKQAGSGESILDAAARGEPVGQVSEPAAESTTVIVALAGEDSEEGELTLQGSIQVGLQADALSDEAAAAVLTCRRPSCRQTAEKIAEHHGGLEPRPFPPEHATVASALEALPGEYPGQTVILTADQQTLHRIRSALEGLSPEETTPREAAAASITRITLRSDMSYSLRFNDTDHLDGVTDSDRFRML
jgi:broad specificity phosphatase PhoE